MFSDPFFDPERQHSKSATEKNMLSKSLQTMLDELSNSDLDEVKEYIEAIQLTKEEDELPADVDDEDEGDEAELDEDDEDETDEERPPAEPMKVDID